EHLEELLHHRNVADLRDGLPASMQIAALAERDELLDHGAKLLGIRQRGGDLLVLDQRRSHVGEHRLAMLRRAVELAVNLTVTHRVLSLHSSAAQRLSSDPRSALPALRCSPVATPALPCRDGGPSVRALP